MYDFIAKIRFNRICKALKLEPRKELKDYVFDDELYIFEGGRCNGKTTAAIVKAMVYKQVSSKISKLLLDIIFLYDQDYDSYNKKRTLMYEDQLMKHVYTCTLKGIDVYMKHSSYRNIRKEQKKFEKYIKNDIKTTNKLYKNRRKL